jgi:hypothetical protein
MNRIRKKHNAAIKAKVAVAAVGGTGRSPSWRVSSAFIRTGSTTGGIGEASVFEGGGGARASLGKRSLEKRRPSDGGPRVRIHLAPAESPSLARNRLPRSRIPAFPAGVRGWARGMVGRDSRVP